MFCWKVGNAATAPAESYTVENCTQLLYSKRFKRFKIQNLIIELSILKGHKLKKYTYYVRAGIMYKYNFVLYDVVNFQIYGLHLLYRGKWISEEISDVPWEGGSTCDISL